MGDRGLSEGFPVIRSEPNKNMQQVLPDKESIYEMLNLLLGEDMTVEYKNRPAQLDKTYVAMYADAEGVPHALCACDVAFAAYSGGAMTMMPPNTVKNAADDDDLSDMLRDNLYEVMNICTRLVIDDNTPHLKLTEVKRASEIPEIVERMLATGNRGDYEVSIPRYGAGTMTFLVS